MYICISIYIYPYSLLVVPIGIPYHAMPGACKSLDLDPCRLPNRADGSKLLWIHLQLHRVGEMSV